jgi:GDPmannose 4,6-dehydratase
MVNGLEILTKASAMSKTALICGVSGQDGAYLARYLLEQGYQVFGSSRDAQMPGFGNLQLLGIRDRVGTLSMAPTDFRSVLQAVNKVEPDEIYNFAGQSSVGLSFEQPVETLESISVGTLNLLESIRFLGSSTAGTTIQRVLRQHGDVPQGAPFRPRSPYAVARGGTGRWPIIAGHLWLVRLLGILFNHESPARSDSSPAVEPGNRISKVGTRG